MILSAFKGGRSSRLGKCYANRGMTEILPQASPCAVNVSTARVPDLIELMPLLALHSPTVPCEDCDVYVITSDSKGEAYLLPRVLHFSCFHAASMRCLRTGGTLV